MNYLSNQTLLSIMLTFGLFAVKRQNTPVLIKSLESQSFARGTVNWTCSRTWLTKYTSSFFETEVLATTTLPSRPLRRIWSVTKYFVICTNWWAHTRTEISKLICFAWYTNIFPLTSPFIDASITKCFVTWFDVAHYRTN